ncbi:hypothetical protein BLNAU_22723 [Blattamonas nauphoetae]|uniref:Uncharacterized protein n=1 Tax=Blattamonas nauphoetae TaxID=2049346 RepID=A0ABQ9WSB0_9EUKA|nr:hypothetical protein BLNAU_22723 [Blattamonas nauphoetae]
MLTKAARRFNTKLTRTTNCGLLNTRQTRPPLRLDLVAMKSIFSCDSASDHFQHVLSLRGSGPRDDCWPLDEDVPRHPTKHALSSPTHRQCSLTRFNHRSGSACGGLWVFGGRSEEKLLLNDVHAFAATTNFWESSLPLEHDLRFGENNRNFRRGARPASRLCWPERDGSIDAVHLPHLSRFGLLTRPNFVFSTPFSFQASAFPKTPIDVAACTVDVEDGIVRMGGLVDGDEVRPFRPYWTVSGLAHDSSDAKCEVQTASGRI